ncbi:hypothetical protein TUM18999_06930 [Pseudomonas tohonis]|uniref:Uncharacterized protein n=1 Tax=Pseudomonas tohonis TaxID=2725477 RepID=A0A6J4DYC7_9PSED|nr:hypothetical protein TUM18999_06930 [Pseudomonas tohonis]GJN53532.1 hypothetical protein TUM20286_32840 [Pseudomonas tohonis]
MLRRVVVQGALGAAVESRVTLLVAAQALGPEPEPVFHRALVDRAAESPADIFGFAYEYTFYFQALHVVLQRLNQVLWPLD